jgi:hypothetical protein
MAGKMVSGFGIGAVMAVATTYVAEASQTVTYVDMCLYTTADDET